MAEPHEGIKPMTNFGKVEWKKTTMANKDAVTVDLEKITEISQLPKSMQLTAEDIDEDATLANFICYCDIHGVDKQHIIAQTGYSEEEISQIVEEAKEAGIYKELARDFLKTERQL